MLLSAIVSWVLAVRVLIAVASLAPAGFLVSENVSLVHHNSKTFIQIIVISVIDIHLVIQLLDVLSASWLVVGILLFLLFYVYLRRLVRVIHFEIALNGLIDLCGTFPSCLVVSHWVSLSHWFVQIKLVLLVLWLHYKIISRILNIRIANGLSQQHFPLFLSNFLFDSLLLITDLG